MSLNTLVMLIVIVSTVYPFLSILAQSFSAEGAVVARQVLLFPVKPTTVAYRVALSDQLFWISYRNTVVYVLLSIAIHLSLTVLCAYPLSKKRLKGRVLFTTLILTTMFFSGGLIPNYILITKLRLIDTTWAVVIPGAISVWNVIIMRTFFQGIPTAVEEAAEIDGMHQFGTLFYIVLPLSKAILATITLFIAVGQWNNWVRALLYLNTNTKYPVTLFLRNLIAGYSVDQNLELLQVGNEQPMRISETLKAATIMLVSVPILILYPFLQKHFIKGVMIGSLKG